MSFLERTLSAYKREEVITPYLEEALAKADWPEEYPVKVFNKERKWDGKFHPSSDITAGDMQLYYKFSPKFSNMLQEERITPTLQMTFQIGSACHSIIQSMLIHLGFTKLEDVEVKFLNEERNISGTTDLRRVSLPNGREFLVDIKTCNQLPKEVAEYHAMQVRVYGDNIPDAPEELAVVYFEKSYPHRIRDFIVKRDQGKLDELYEKWERVRVAIRDEDTSKLRSCCLGPNDDRFLKCPARGFCERWNNL